MRKCNLWYMLLFLPISMFAENETLDISTSCSLKHHASEDEIYLAFVIRNQTNQAVAIKYSQLPWKSISSLRLILTKPFGTDASGLEPRFPISTPGPYEIVIDPGESCSGEINLTSLYPGLKEAVMGKDIIVFWSHQIRFDDDRRSKRSGGALFIEGKKGGGAEWELKNGSGN